MSEYRIIRDKSKYWYTLQKKVLWFWLSIDCTSLFRIWSGWIDEYDCEIIENGGE